MDPGVLERLRVYHGLISSFVDGKKAAGEFEAEFLREFKQETVRFGALIFDALDELFADVDAYCADPDLRDDDDLDEEQLRRSATRAREILSANLEANRTS